MISCSLFVSVAIRAASSPPALFAADSRGYRRLIEPDFALAYPLDRLEQHFSRLPLEYDARTTEEHGAAVHLRVFDGRQHKDAHVPSCGGQLLEEPETAMPSQIEFEQDNIGLLAGDECEGLFLIARFSDNSEALPAFDQYPQARANYYVVVYQRDAYLRRIYSVHIRPPYFR